MPVQQLTAADVAARLGVTRCPVRRYRLADRAERFPELDGMIWRNRRRDPGSDIRALASIRSGHDTLTFGDIAATSTD